MIFDKMINTIQLGSCYDLIKGIPNNSIDLVYIDIPYLFKEGGSSPKSGLSERIRKLKKEDLKDIIKGIDYSILDELCRVMKHIYIYMVF